MLSLPLLDIMIGRGRNSDQHGIGGPRSVALNLLCIRERSSSLNIVSQSLTGRIVRLLTQNRTVE